MENWGLWTFMLVIATIAVTISDPVRYWWMSIPMVLGLVYLVSKARKV